MRILVLNAGSRTLKASVVVGGVTEARAEVETRDVEFDLGAVLERLGVDLRPDAVTHRIVHGGERFITPVIADAAVVEALRGLVELAPLHMPPALGVLEAATQRFPRVPQVCCFDTAYHATLPETETRYPVPDRWSTEWGIRRYGFHGLSVEWAVGRAAALLGRPLEDLCLVIAHLGGGCSVTAVDGGRSVRTSMGYTPLEGLMMGTRSGSVDPGMLIGLLRTRRLDVDGLSHDLEHRSGILGVSAISADVREVQAAADAGDVRAELALAMFAARTASGIAAAATALPRLDAIVCTGGIGEHAGQLRAATIAQLGVLGVAPIESDETGHDRVLASAARGTRALPGAGSGLPVLRVEAREDLICAAHAEALISPA
ncbi:MAG: acetate/propionate family kinase [Chloroflexi bacterium]|nr:acetate/propionate family kinase [Chloroflexota bacterium]